MISKDWNNRLKLLKVTKPGLKLFIKSRATSSSGHSCFTIRWSGKAKDTICFSISMTVELSGSQTNLKFFSITCKSTIWRPTRCRSSWKLRVAFQTLVQQETRYSAPPFATSACTNTTATGERSIQTGDTPASEWSPLAMSGPHIPHTGSHAELLDGSRPPGL